MELFGKVLIIILAGLISLTLPHVCRRVTVRSFIALFSLSNSGVLIITVLFCLINVPTLNAQDCGCDTLLPDGTPAGKRPIGSCINDPNGDSMYSTWRVCIRNSDCSCYWYDTGNSSSCTFSIAEDACPSAPATTKNKKNINPQEAGGLSAGNQSKSRPSNDSADKLGGGPLFAQLTDECIGALPSWTKPCDDAVDEIVNYYNIAPEPTKVCVQAWRQYQKCYERNAFDPSYTPESSCMKRPACSL